MGVLFVDSYDHYTSIPMKYQANNGCTIMSDWGRFGTAGIGSGHGGNYIARTVPGSLSTIYIGVAINPSTLPYARRNIISLYDSLQPDWQCGLWMLQNSGTLQAVRGTGSQLGVSTQDVPVGTWSYIEVKFVISDSIGEIVVKLDGDTVINVTGADTKYTSNASFSTVYLYGMVPDYSSQPNCYFDDLYFADDQFYGDCRVECRMPTGEGYYEQWDPSSSVHNYSCVDETPPSTTDYVTEDAHNIIDTYTRAALTSGSGDIYAVMMNLYCQKTSAGTKQVAAAARLSDTDSAGTGVAVPSSWGFLQLPVSRPGGGNWTVSDVNAAEIGQKIID